MILSAGLMFAHKTLLNIESIYDTLLFWDVNKTQPRQNGSLSLFLEQGQSAYSSSLVNIDKSCFC
jgi:hypothetical protein